MKVYLSADIEGVCGIADWAEADQSEGVYAEFRERMTLEVIAACEGALAAGATEILVKDAHWTGRNVFAEHLPREARLVRGWSGHPFSMVQELDESFHALAFIGWHSGAGRGGNPLAHTMSSSTLARVSVNGEPASEFLLHAYAARSVRVPVVFVSGDEGLCGEVRRFDERIRTVGVMRGEGASTIGMHPAAAREAIRDGIKAAFESDVKAFELGLPERFAVELTYKDARRAYRSSFYPGAKLASPTSIAFETGDWFEVLRLIQFVV